MASPEGDTFNPASGIIRRKFVYRPSTSHLSAVLLLGVLCLEKLPEDLLQGVMTAVIWVLKHI